VAIAKAVATAITAKNAGECSGGPASELKSSEAKEKIKFIVDIAKERNVTLLYGARDKEHNDAVVLKKVIERELGH
jgi:hypothetical protein